MKRQRTYAEQYLIKAEDSWDVQLNNPQNATVNGFSLLTNTNPTNISGIKFPSINSWPMPASSGNTFDVYDFAKTTTNFPCTGLFGVITNVQCDGIDTGTNIVGLQFIRIGGILVIRLPKIRVTADDGNCFGLTAGTLPIGYRISDPNGDQTHLLPAVNSDNPPNFAMFFQLFNDGTFQINSGDIARLTTGWGSFSSSVFMFTLI